MYISTFDALRKGHARTFSPELIQVLVYKALQNKHDAALAPALTNFLCLI
jgi:hypothetical protein